MTPPCDHAWESRPEGGFVCPKCGAESKTPPRGKAGKEGMDRPPNSGKGGVTPMPESDWGVTKCPKCRGWARCIKDWITPHFPAGKSRVCAGSSRRTKGEVFTEKQFFAWAAKVRADGHTADEVRNASGPQGE